MTVEEAINRLREQVAPRLSERPEIREAISMAITALEIWEKEKEPQPEQADKSSSKNNSIDNDNTRLKICQEIIEEQLELLFKYFSYQLSNEEQNVFNEGQRHRELLFVRKTLEEATK